MNLDLVKTIVVVMMENRSFDHVLGYLSLPPCNRTDVDGLKADKDWLAKCANIYDGIKFSPFPLSDPYHDFDTDPVHERAPIALQMGKPVDGIFPMDGYVQNYVNSKGNCLTVGNPPPVMGYYTAKQVPVMDFFAINFLICDRWFSALPAGTQPNRLIAMSGETKIDINHQPIPSQKLVFDWLTEHKISWRVYHEGMPFFALMLEWVPEILEDKNFRPLEQLYEDIDNRDDEGDEFPKVIFIEPTYTDSPHIGASSDDHAPSAIKNGQEFLSTVYRNITSDPDFWQSAVLIITYDEHGGFFDHVSPPKIRTEPPAGETYPPFETLGVRVPTLIVSPFVKPGSVYHEPMDHTSILKFIASKFNGGKYSPAVDARQVGNVLDVLQEQLREAKSAPAMPSLDEYLAQETPPAGYVSGVTPSSPIQKSFQDALEEVRKIDTEHAGKFKDLLNKFPARKGN